MDPRIFGLLQQVGAAEEAEQERLRAETNDELARHFMRHPNELEELAFDLLNLAWADSLNSDILPRVIEVKTVGLTEVDYIEDDLRGMVAYWQGKGGQIRSGILRYERERMPTEEIVAAIDMHQDEFRTDFWGPFDKLAAHAQEKMRILPVERLVELVQAAVNGGVTYGTFAAATLTAAQVDSVLDEVALNSGGQVTIMGSLVAVRQLANVGLDFGDNIAEQVFRTGVRSASTRATTSSRSRTSRTSWASSCCRTTSSGSSAATPGG